MKTRILPSIAVLAGLLVAEPSLAETTPEDAVAAYIEGVTEQDFSAIIAATAADKMTEGFDFVAHVGRIGSLTIVMDAPANDHFLIEINRATFVARIAAQVKVLTYGLMTSNAVVEGQSVQMDAAGAAEFASVVRADRLSELALVKIGIPKPKIVNSEGYQALSAKKAKVYGADASTERVALMSFDGLTFVVGFSLLRYGDDWTVVDQSSAIANLSLLGAPKRMTPEEFEKMLK